MKYEPQAKRTLSVDVETDLVAQVLELCRQRGIALHDAVSEALRQLVEMQRPKAT